MRRWVCLFFLLPKTVHSSTCLVIGSTLAAGCLTLALAFHLFASKTSGLDSQHSSCLFYDFLAYSWCPELFFPIHVARNKYMTMLYKDMYSPEKYPYLNILQLIEIIKINRSYHTHLLIITSIFDTLH